VPGGIAGTPYRGGYRYGGRALQVGGWVTVWQLITITKLTLRKPKLWPQKERSKNIGDWQKLIKDTNYNGKDL
jgi:hypothetical protein